MSSISRFRPDIHCRIIGIVFLGGCIGTGLRYSLAQIPALGVDGFFHIGTFAANLIACCIYSGLSAYLYHSPWIETQRREYVNRGFGMGVCGGLSTMSTLGVETFTTLRSGTHSPVHSLVTLGFVYLLVSFLAGLIVASIGSWIGETIALTHESNTQPDEEIVQVKETTQTNKTVQTDTIMRTSTAPQNDTASQTNETEEDTNSAVDIQTKNNIQGNVRSTNDELNHSSTLNPTETTGDHQ